MLRSPQGELPQPTLADVTELITEARTAGMQVTAHVDVAGEVPGGVGRTAFRVVQEGLTNVRKHAAKGSPVEVSVTGRPGAELVAKVVDHPGPSTAGPVAPPDTDSERVGRGLAGLRERVHLAAGNLEVGRTADGGFRIAARLPWPGEGGAP